MFFCRLVLIVVFLLSGCLGWSHQAEEALDVNYQKAIARGINAQKITVARIAQLSRVIRDYVKREGRTPNDLLSLVTGETQYVKAEYAEELFLDGWGNRLFYHSTGGSFVLASFGQDGKPDKEGRQKAGGWSSEFNFDADIVRIGNEWAQTPEGVPR